MKLRTYFSTMVLALIIVVLSIPVLIHTLQVPQTGIQNTQPVIVDWTQYPGVTLGLVGGFQTYNWDNDDHARLLVYGGAADNSAYFVPDRGSLNRLWMAINARQDYEFKVGRAVAQLTFTDGILRIRAFDALFPGGDEVVALFNEEQIETLLVQLRQTIVAI
jgi:hypothetical protein